MATDIRNHLVPEGLLDIRDRKVMINELKTTLLLIQSDFDFSHFDAAFQNIERLFNGKYKGYRQCNTSYHDFRHTMMVLLAMVRLMHGASLQGVIFPEKQINMGLISALMHDAGYIQSTDEHVGTGARYTLTHIGRSIAFIQRHFANYPYFSEDMKDFHDILSCTGVHTMVADIEFSSNATALLGKMLGTADLLGQMADRLYLEKLMLLYSEFEEGAVPGFDSEIDLFRKTVSFYRRTKARFENEFANVNRYMSIHFRERWHVDGNPYEESIEKNINYLKFILKSSQKDIYHSLRRNAISFQ